MSADILARIAAAHEAVPIVKVNVPEWGVDLYFRKEITLSRRKAINTGIDAKDEAAVMISFLIHEAMDADGKPVFKGDADTWATLEGKASGPVIQRIFFAINAGETVDEAKND